MMTRTCTVLSITFSLLLINSCRQYRNTSKIERDLSKLIEKFPQLPKSKEHLSDFYKVVRTVIIGASGIQIQLRSTPDTVNESQSIITVTNSSNHTYSMPLLSNMYRDYWQFQFDTVFNRATPTNSTFQRELQKCI